MRVLPPKPEDWTGAVVRLRDGRLAHVQIGDTRYLAVHTEDDVLVEVDRREVTMRRPPLGFTSTGLHTPAAEEALDRAPWWAGIIGLVSLLVIVGWTVYYLSTGAR